jgi:hypothetical protein
VDQETLALLKRFSRHPGIEKAKTEFDRAQKAEERFHKDFDGIDFTKSVGEFRALALARLQANVE